MPKPEKKPTNTREPLAPLSMHGLTPEQALGGAMRVPPPPEKAKKEKGRPSRKKA